MGSTRTGIPGFVCLMRRIASAAAVTAFGRGKIPGEDGVERGPAAVALQSGEAWRQGRPRASRDAPVGRGRDGSPAAPWAGPTPRGRATAAPARWPRAPHARARRGRRSPEPSPCLIPTPSLCAREDACTGKSGSLAAANQGLAGVRHSTASATKPPDVLGSIIEEAPMRRIVPFSACLFAGAVLFVAPPSTTAAAVSPPVSPLGLQQGLALDDGLQLARRGGGGGFAAAVVVSLWRWWFPRWRLGGGGRAFRGGGFSGGRSFAYRGVGPGWGGARISRRPASAWCAGLARPALRVPRARLARPAVYRARASGAAGPTIAVRVHGAAGPTSTAVGGDAAGTARAIGRRPTTTAAAPWCAGGCGHLTAGASGGCGAATTDKPC